MSDKQVVGTCSLCGGPVEQCTKLQIVGPFPPPQCRNCGAVKKNKYGPVIDMETSPGKGGSIRKVLGREGKGRD